MDKQKAKELKKLIDECEDKELKDFIKSMLAQIGIAFIKGIFIGVVSIILIILIFNLIKC